MNPLFCACLCGKNGITACADIVVEVVISFQSMVLLFASKDVIIAKLQTIIVRCASM